jgi:hypothetical protein
MNSTYPHSEHYIKLKATIPVSIIPTGKVKTFSILLGLQSHWNIYLFNHLLFKVYLTIIQQLWLQSIKMAGWLIMWEWSSPNFGHCWSIVWQCGRNPQKLQPEQLVPWIGYKPSTSKVLVTIHSLNPGVIEHTSQFHMVWSSQLHYPVATFNNLAEYITTGSSLLLFKLTLTTIMLLNHYELCHQ